VRPDVLAKLDAAKTRTQRFEDALKQLRDGQHREAREALYKIASEDPHTRKFRVYLSLAWGMEHRAAKRLDDAERELERALSLDPDFKEAADELDKVREERGKGGIFSKLFGR
jgi:Tfp pilus assembly protein PilF